MVRRQHGNSQEHVTKHIFVTGGVVSSLGKGLTASSLGRLLRSRGIKVLQQKLDPYINVDPGTMNPFQHGEVYVTEDGAETDLDIGHYERFLDVYLSQKANVTTGQIYQEVLRKERAGEYLGQCVQVIPHITNEIKSRMRAQASDDVDVIITEIGGTVGDIESQPFLEAAREVRRDLGAENCMFVHVSLVPYIAAAHELKTKPTQHSVMMLRQLGISPDALVLRSDRPLNQSIKDKIDPKFATRSVNEGFSGGEKKRAEVLQLELLKPKFAILDETDSGLDVDALRIVSEGVNRAKEANQFGILMVTHYTRILKYIKPDIVHVFAAGHFVKTGGPELADELEESGYDAYLPEGSDSESALA